MRESIEVEAAGGIRSVSSFKAMRWTLFQLSRTTLLGKNELQLRLCRKKRGLGLAGVPDDEGELLYGAPQAGLQVLTKSRHSATHCAGAECCT